MKRLVLINVVGLTPKLLKSAESVSTLASAPGYTALPWSSPLPAVTSTCQATMMTGLAPRDHGIVANGWFYPDTQEIRFWQQANSLVQGRKFYDDVETANMFWWFNQGSSVKYFATPKPHYGCDGSKVFDIIDQTGCNLVHKHGPFPFFAFWGPGAGLASSRWIADATATVMRTQKPQLTLCYLPHLDYDYQRYPDQDPARVQEVDQCVATVMSAADDIGADVVIVSEYGLRPVQRCVHLNRLLRGNDLLSVRGGPFGEMLMPGESRAFAVADHQLAHIYVRDPSDVPTVAKMLDQSDGVQSVFAPEDLELDHPRSGQLIALADPDAWFSYYYWDDDRHAPDFARTVDIHRKPGYDPCELFKTSMPRVVARLLQKKLGFRYKMDVVPLDPALVRGSHGLHPDDSADGPIIIGPQDPPDDMRGFSDYVTRLLQSSPI
ncbi:Type I phosphodiesterase / nucleotide pyrophosphatase [Crateriforma conspicua]|uniref:Type I phosphodiesterase / nucleotide pyrophosphatase n=1 Tax=Crateriforma conspicua TaxID=2527996 RepID=A0A5C6FRY0_9PLAN|nr:nucleotide pyrophosphatase/phosphodiesterase family protein [Crateriforma conspicua]TWU65081.1 Type I phosphodiesterase / nucleotide pyrophosphatase [Crateriforma conspicua]